MSQLLAVGAPEAAPPAAWTVIAIGACFSFMFLWVFDKAFRHLFAPLLNKIAGISLNAKFVHWAPFGFLHTIVTHVEDWTHTGLAASERAISYGIGSLLWAFYDLAFTIVKTTYDFNTAIDNVWARLTRDAVPAKAAVSKAQIQKLKAQIATLDRRLDRAEHAKQGAVGAAASPDLKLLSRGIDRLNARVNTLTHELHGVAHADVHTGAQAHPATIGVPHWLSRRLSRVEKATVGLGAVGLVAVALGRMGLGWLRCPSLGRIGRKVGCGGFGFLEMLLAETFEAMVFLDLCRFALAAQRLSRSIVPHLGDLLLLQGAVCLGGGASLPSAADSPKLTTKIELPSAHD